jgi:hypothetical protein
VLGAIGYGIYNTLSKDTGSRDLVTKSVAMIGKIKQMYGSGTFAGISGTSVDNFGARPDNWKMSGTDLIDNLGNTVDINGAANFYAIRFQGLTKDSCAAIASGLQNVAYQVAVGSASAVSIAAGVITGGSNYKATGGVPDPSLLSTGCGATEPLAIALQIR